MANKYLEKIASVAGFVAKARQMAGSAKIAIKNYAAQIPRDADRLRLDMKNAGRVNRVFGPGTLGKMVAKNKAVQVGAGVIATGAAAGKMLSKRDK
jgi:hypothetical protein